MKTFYFEDTPGQTIYAFPEAQSLASWNSLRVACTEAASPNTGRYSVSLDETIDWVLFASASQPANFDDNIGKISKETTVAPSGARTITLTVLDNVTGNPLQSVLARFTKGGLSYVVSTNASGQCVLNLDDGTWTVALTLANYSFGGDVAVISADTPLSYEMNPLTTPVPTVPNTCNVSCPVFRGPSPVKGATVTAELESKASGNATGVQLTLVASVRTDNNGVAILQLPWSAGYTSGNGVYRIKAVDPQTGILAYERRVTVPSQSTANISSLPTAP